VAVAARLLALDQAEQLQERRLEQQARREEQQRALMLQHFIAGIRHELNTPLSLQGHWLELIDELMPSGEASPELLGAALASMRQGQAQMVRLMDAIKSCSGQLASVGRERVELLAWLRQYLAARGSARGPAVALDPESRTAWLWLEPHALSAVLDELLDNVALHAPGCTARLRLAVDAQGTRLEVDDDGPGWPEGDARRLLLPFSGRMKHQGHMGLGGFIAHNLAIELLGARLAPAPSQHGGACVRLSWPPAVPEPAREERP
jgi:signal transduction histidine kinase